MCLLIKYSCLKKKFVSIFKKDFDNRVSCHRLSTTNSGDAYTNFAHKILHS